MTHMWGDRIGFIRLGLDLAAGAFRPPTTAYGFLQKPVHTDVIEVFLEAFLVAGRMHDIDPRTEVRLQTLIAEASSLVPSEGGRLLLVDDYDVTYLRGDRTGFVRLGLGLAAGAFRPPTAENAVHTGTEGLIELPPVKDCCFAGRMTGRELRTRSRQAAASPAW
jgi:hypothetical protein